MSMIETLKRQIADLEKKIAESTEDVDGLKALLQQLRMREFEEDIKESDNRQFLRD